MRHFLSASPKKILKTVFIGSTAMIAACSNAESDPNAIQTTEAQSKGLTVKHVDAQGAYALLSSNPTVTVLDIRSPKEIRDGHIDGAVFANFFDEDFEQQLTRLDRNKPYIVHCKGGGRSTKALTVLEDLGFTDITHMDGGLDDWKRDALPLTKL